MRPLLVMIRTGRQETQEYILRSIAPHYRIHLFTTAELTWEAQFLDGYTHVDTLDLDAMIKAAHDLPGLVGVMTWDEARTVQTAQLSEAFGLPGSSSAARLCRDKQLTRQALDAAAVAQPRSSRVRSLEEALEQADIVGYPAIIKPTDLALSHGVVKVSDPAHLVQAYEYVNSLTHRGDPDWKVKILVEEYVTGEEISVDSAVHRGEVTPLCLAHKEIGYDPYCIEVGHYVYGKEPLLEDPRLLKLLRDTHKAIGFEDGVTHTEIMLTADGPKIIEVNGRIGGDMIGYLGLLASGVDTALAAADVACGRPPTVKRELDLVAAVRFFYPKQNDTQLAELGFGFDKTPAALDRAVILGEAGTVKSPPPAGTIAGRIAFATAVCASRDECAEALDAAEKALYY